MLREAYALEGFFGKEMICFRHWTGWFVRCGKSCA